MDEANDNYTQILLEQIRDQNEALLEAAKNQATRDDVYRLEDQLTTIEQNVKVIKAAVTDQSKELKHHTARIGRLEGKAA